MGGKGLKQARNHPRTCTAALAHPACNPKTAMTHMVNFDRILWPAGHNGETATNTLDLFAILSAKASSDLVVLVWVWAGSSIPLNR